MKTILLWTSIGVGSAIFGLVAWILIVGTQNEALLASTPFIALMGYALIVTPIAIRLDVTIDPFE